jgi:lipid II:glycine glycyltransferase (peptidoglycan interpeptide bridge formation enzyme)
MNKELLDLRQTKEYISYIRSLGWEADEFQRTYIYIKRFLFWKFVKVQRPGSLDIRSFNEYLLRKYRFSTIYLEPGTQSQYEHFLKLGFKKYNSPYLPSKTIQVDLTKTETQLLNQMHYKTRYNIKKTGGDNLIVTSTGDINKFADFWQKCAKDRGMFLDQRREIKMLHKAFDKNSDIWIATDIEKKWLAAIFQVSTDDISYYMYAASSKEGKKLYAPTILAWKAVESAKQKRKKIFDFEGVFDERFPLNSWRGFTRFKKSFGGREVEYPGCLVRVIF